LQQELRGLLKDHPQLSASTALVRSAKQGEEIAQAPFLPTVTIVGDGGYENTDSVATRLTGRDLSTSRYSSSLSMIWNVFDGYASTSGRESARIDSKIAAQAERRTSQAVILEGASAYLDVLRQNDLLRLALSNEETIKTQLKLEDERVKRGSGVAVDVLLAKSRLQVSKEQRTTIETGLADANSRYNQVFGHPAVVAEMQAPALPLSLLPDSIADAVALVDKNNPAVLTSQRRIDRASQSQRGAKAGYYPRFDIVAQQNWEDDVDGVDGDRRDYALLGRVTWELFSGFATRARTSQAAEEYSAAMQSARYVSRKSHEELELAWHQFTSTDKRRELLANAVTIAAEVFEARKTLHDVGNETTLNVLDAENELLTACINLVNADFENRVSVYRVLFAMGHLEADAVLTAIEKGEGGSLAQTLPRSAEACRFSAG
jgi:adhesin transport system outer membrane protein